MFFLVLYNVTLNVQFPYSPFVQRNEMSVVSLIYFD